LKEPAHHYFQKEGKLIRPLLNFSLAELLFATQDGKKTFKRSVFNSYYSQLIYHKIGHLFKPKRLGFFD